ncbi:MAG TPA: hypothetical protein VGP53_07865 [Acidimicrobiales bacterium]|nr:hypothetical protein [Acidimicrobiales bacterium]
MPESTTDERRRLRAFALAHHPDRGGDPATFVAGLAALRQGRSNPAEAPLVYRRRRGVAGWLGLGRPRPPSRSLD